MSNFLSIRLVTKSDFHKDIHLSIPSLDVSCYSDSYFFALDGSTRNNFTGYLKVVDVLTYILRYWLLEIGKLENNEIVYLPFDFSDQYIGCFRVQMIDNELLSVSYGFTETIRGIDISPSDVDKI